MEDQIKKMVVAKLSKLKSDQIYKGRNPLDKVATEILKENRLGKLVSLIDVVCPVQVKRHTVANYICFIACLYNTGS